ncbi:hypothetical protein IAT38_002613 [Cryptococcus sp. DSM 104549]
MEPIESPLTRGENRRLAPTAGTQSTFKNDPYWADAYRTVETMLNTVALPGEFDDGSSPYKMIEVATPDKSFIKISSYDGSDAGTWQATITMALEEGEGSRKLPTHEEIL